MQSKRPRLFVATGGALPELPSRPAAPPAVRGSLETLPKVLVENIMSGVSRREETAAARVSRLFCQLSRESAKKDAKLCEEMKAILRKEQPAPRKVWRDSRLIQVDNSFFEWTLANKRHLFEIAAQAVKHFFMLSLNVPLSTLKLQNIINIIRHIDRFSSLSAAPVNYDHIFGAIMSDYEIRENDKKIMRFLECFDLNLRRRVSVQMLQVSTRRSEAAVEGMLVICNRLDCSNNIDYTALLYEAISGCGYEFMPRIMSMLITRGANPSAICSDSQDGHTLLMRAARYGYEPDCFASVNVLLDAGADAQARDAAGKTALDHAHPAIRSYLADAIEHRAIAPPAITSPEVPTFSPRP